MKSALIGLGILLTLIMTAAAEDLSIEQADQGFRMQMTYIAKRYRLFAETPSSTRGLMEAFDQAALQAVKRESMAKETRQQIRHATSKVIDQLHAIEMMERMRARLSQEAEGMRQQANSRLSMATYIGRLGELEDLNWRIQIEQAEAVRFADRLGMEMQEARAREESIDRGSLDDERGGDGNGQPGVMNSSGPAGSGTTAPSGGNSMPTSGCGGH